MIRNIELTNKLLLPHGRYSPYQNNIFNVNTVTRIPVLVVKKYPIDVFCARYALRRGFI